jgi:hypothetical protein
VAVTSLWADARVYYPLHVEPYTPARRLPRGQADPAFRTKPQLAVQLVAAAGAAGVPFRAVVADGFYGDSPALAEGSPPGPLLTRDPIPRTSLPPGPREAGGHRLAPPPGAGRSG